MLGQCQSKIQIGSGMLQGMKLGMVLHFSINMVMSTINLPLKKFFLFIHMLWWGKKFDVIEYYVLNRTSSAPSLFKVNYSFNSESQNFYFFLK